MTVQLSTAARNAMLEALEIAYNGQTLAGGSGAGGSVTGTAAQPKLQLYTGSMPANCAAAATGTKLVEMTLPADWMSAAGSGTKALAGTWQSTGLAAGSAGYYRIVDNAGTTCHEQGTVTATGGGGDMTLDNVSIASGQTVTITSKSITAPNA